jgi:putative transposase
MECVLGVPFGYESNEEFRKILEDFRDMVNFCIDYAYRRKLTPLCIARKGVYEKWKRSLTNPKIIRGKRMQKLYRA